MPEPADTYLLRYSPVSINVLHTTVTVLWLLRSSTSHALPSTPVHKYMDTQFTQDFTLPFLYISHGLDTTLFLPGTLVLGQVLLLYVSFRFTLGLDMVLFIYSILVMGYATSHWFMVPRCSSLPTLISRLPFAGRSPRWFLLRLVPVYYYTPCVSPVHIFFTLNSRATLSRRFLLRTG